MLNCENFRNKNDLIFFIHIRYKIFLMQMHYLIERKKLFKYLNYFLCIIN